MAAHMRSHVGGWGGVGAGGAHCAGVSADGGFDGCRIRGSRSGEVQVAPSVHGEGEGTQEGTAERQREVRQREGNGEGGAHRRTDIYTSPIWLGGTCAEREMERSRPARTHGGTSSDVASRQMEEGRTDIYTQPTCSSFAQQQQPYTCARTHAHTLPGGCIDGVYRDTARADDARVRGEGEVGRGEGGAGRGESEAGRGEREAGRGGGRRDSHAHMNIDATHTLLGGCIGGVYSDAAAGNDARVRGEGGEDRDYPLRKLGEHIRSTSTHTATHCNILQHTATHCNILQQHIRSTSTQSSEPCEVAQYPQQKNDARVRGEGEADRGGGRCNSYAHVNVDAMHTRRETWRNTNVSAETAAERVRARYTRGAGSAQMCRVMSRCVCCSVWCCCVLLFVAVCCCLIGVALCCSVLLRWVMSR